MYTFSKIMQRKKIKLCFILIKQTLMEQKESEIAEDDMSP